MVLKKEISSQQRNPSPEEAKEALLKIQAILRRNTCSAEELYALTEEALHEYAIRQRALEYLTIEEIMDRLCRWYDTEVFYANDDVRGKRFTGVIVRFTDVADVLHLIGETATVQFNLKGNTITVSDSR